MSAQKASAPVRFARSVVAAILVVLAAAVILHLLRERGGPRPEAVKLPPDDRAVDLKEKVRHEEYTNGKLRTEVRGANFFLGPDGRNHLEGSVEITAYGPAGEVVSRITADEVVYDTAAVRFGITGRVRVEAGDVVLEGESFDYDKDGGLFRTASGGAFSSKRMAGTAAEISYAKGADEVRLAGGFRAELAAAGRAEEKIVLSGDSLLYGRRERRGRAEGRAAFECAEFKGASAAASFVASQDESSLESAVFEGAAKVVLSGKESSGEGSGEICADRIAVAFYRDPSGLSIKTSGRSSLLFRSAADRTETVLAPTALLSFDRVNGSWTWSASGGIRAEIAEAGVCNRTLEGDSAAFDGAKTLGVFGKPGRPAVADSAEARIQAPQILVASASGEVLATGGVVGVLKGGEERRAVGFFSPREDVTISSERLELRPKISMSFLTGDVFVRQGTNTLRAAEVELAGDAGRMSGGGGVAVTLTEAAEGQVRARTIELGGQDMVYSPGPRTLTLTSKAYVRLPEANLEAGRVSAVIGREGKGVESLSAAMGVAVSKGRYVGRSEAAIYQAATGRITLTGKPVLTDAEGGSSRGDKLTFDLGDDKISIENEGQGRSTTVIKKP
jgi:lipopolysaccharide export system protein LptA